jgi:hypothetical protein
MTNSDLQTLTNIFNETPHPLFTTNSGKEQMKALGIDVETKTLQAKLFALDGSGVFSGSNGPKNLAKRYCSKRGFTSKEDNGIRKIPLEHEIDVYQISNEVPEKELTQQELQHMMTA